MVVQRFWIYFHFCSSISSYNSEMISLEKKYLDYESGTKREWVVANGLGGYASSTVINLNTRKYHGLLVAALHERFLLLSNLEEEILIDRGIYELSNNKYPGVVHPKGFGFLENFNFNYFPEFIYHVCGLSVKKTVFTVSNFNVVVVSYEIEKRKNTGDYDKIFFNIKPLVNSRSLYNNMHSEFNSWSFNEKPNENFTEIKAGYCNSPVLILGSDIMDYSSYSKKGFWVKNMIYERETERGEDDREDHYCTGRFTLNLSSDIRNIKKEKIKFNIIAAAGNDTDANEIFNKFYPKDTVFYEKLLEREKTRIKDVSESAYKNFRKKEKDRVLDLLLCAADSFIIRKKDGKSIIAGYHWFSDWGRDTMISITGLCLTTGRFNDSGEILETYTRYCKKGILPNRFDDYGDPGYNTSDASLWFFYAVHKFLEYTSDYKFVKNNLWSTLKEIVYYYKNGNDSAVMDSDGLIISKPQTTWMDAKIGDFIVTPREGKCVEINTLWYNALKIMETISEKFNEDSSEYAELSEKVRESFNKLFWNDEKKCLYDVVSQTADDSVRPNQIFSVSLPFSILEREKEIKVVEKVFDELYTPYGLRSLSPKAQKYIGVYEGDRYHRDIAYHNGTVWAWLLGHFITAYVKINNKSDESRKNAKKFLSGILDGLNDASAGSIGSVSEIFDGDFPHKPRGCVSQAWSVGEILRCYKEDVL